MSHLKSLQPSSLKLPATHALPHSLVSTLSELPHPEAELPHGTTPATFQDLWYTVDGGVAYVHFNFLDGAASTAQCRRLDTLLHAVCGRADVAVVVLMGGDRYFGSGYNLNTIHASPLPAAEAWANISAATDVTQRLLHCRDKVVVSAVGGDAAAAGLMTALAADSVWTHGDVLLNPHYGPSGLHGSEHWTYTLPNRVGGRDAAIAITSSLQVRREWMGMGTWRVLAEGRCHGERVRQSCDRSQWLVVNQIYVRGELTTPLAAGSAAMVCTCDSDCYRCLPRCALESSRSRLCVPFPPCAADERQRGTGPRHR